MNIIYELEAMRKRMIQEINTEFDILIDRVSKEKITETDAKSDLSYEIEYNLTAGSAIFKGKKPTAVSINGKKISVSTWKQVVEEIMKDCVSDKSRKEQLSELAGRISGRKRSLLSKGDKEMRSPIEFSKGLYMETHYDTESLLRILTTRILVPVEYDFSNIKIYVLNK